MAGAETLSDHTICINMSFHSFAFRKLVTLLSCVAVAGVDVLAETKKP